jgi:hypothetical protein
LANHCQNERDDSTDDSFDEDSLHDLVLPPPPEFEPFEPIPRTPGLAYDDSDMQMTVPRTPGLVSDTHWHGLLYNYEPYYIMEGWNYTEMYTPEPGRRNYSDSRYKELQERRDELERMTKELEERQMDMRE